jgi:hypothetical protein
MDERPNNNPNQQPIADELTLGEALRTIAERTAFRSEEERDKVYAAIDKADRNDHQDDEDDDDTSDDETSTVTGDGPTGNGDADLKAAANGPGSATTPARKSAVGRPSRVK